MKNISAWAIRHPVPPVVLFVVLLFMGTVAFMRLPVTLNPDVSFPAVEVLVFKMAVATGFDAPRASTLCALRPVQDNLAQLRRILTGCNQSAFAAIDFHAVTAASEWDGADMDRRDGANRQPAADEHVVGRGDVEKCVAAGVEPLLGLGHHHGG